jgi:hypothetical protein
MKEIEHCGAWSIATIPSSSGGGFTSWAKKGPITGSHPLNEPGEHVWFEFGATRSIAAHRIKVELGLATDEAAA